jgi:hypothetical protein
MKDMFNCMSSCALQVVGKKSPRKPHHYSDDPEIVKMVAERRDLLLKCNQTCAAMDRGGLRRQINYLKKCIKQRLKHIHGLAADNLAEVINNTDSSRQMFEAARSLAQCRKKATITVNDKHGKTIGSDQLKADALKTYFHEQFNDKNVMELSAFSDPPGSLEDPISESEVMSAVSKLKNGRACGPDGIPNELIKASGPIFNAEVARIYNQSFETNTYISDVGEGILTPLQKPGKPKGELKSIRPLTLLNGARKILSLITLKRIEKYIDDYTGPWQAAYKRGRSCSDLVWAQRMLIAVVTKREFEYSKVNIDMSSAFNTIHRSTTIELLEEAGCPRDGIRLVQYLLSNTKLKVCVNKSCSAMFVFNNGACQGDSLSGKIFTLNLAGALYQIRAVNVCIPRPIQPISILGIPQNTLTTFQVYR